MISLERFENKMRWLADVTGFPVRKDTANALWEELRDTDLNDFESGCKELAYSSDKINLANLYQKIAKYSSYRIEREASQMRQKEADEIREWFRTHVGSRSECVNNYECGECKRTYCDIVSKDCAIAIKRMIMGDINGEEAHRLLAKKFRGIGFEQYMGIEPF